MKSVVITLIVFVGVNQQDRRRTYNVEALWRKHFCLSNAISITYYECMFLAQGIQNPMRMHRVIICSLSGPTILFHIIHHSLVTGRNSLQRQSYLRE
jgi:hypothetical protein